jgi:hypothetical protein
VTDINCVYQAAVVIELVSADSLRKTGIFADKAGDFPRFSATSSAKRASRDESECTKSRDFRPILTLCGDRPNVGMAGWRGTYRTPHIPDHRQSNDFAFLG